MASSINDWYMDREYASDRDPMYDPVNDDSRDPFAFGEDPRTRTLDHGRPTKKAPSRAETQNQPPARRKGQQQPKGKRRQPKKVLPAAGSTRLGNTQVATCEPWHRLCEMR